MRKIDRILKETERAKLVEIAEKKYWIPNKHIEGNMVDDEAFELTELELKLVKIKSKHEDYSEKAFKLILTMVVGDEEKEKFIFLPKSKAKFENGFIITEKWLFDNSINKAIEDEIEYQKKFVDVDEETIQITGYEIF